MKLAKRLMIQGQAQPVDDPYWDNVVLLVQPDAGEPNGSTKIFDISKISNAVHTNFNTNISTALGVPTVCFDGNAYLMFADNRDLLFGSGDFTVDFLANVAVGATGKVCGIWYDTTGSGFSWKVAFFSGKLRFMYSTTGGNNLYFDWAFSDAYRNKMSLYSVCRAGDTLRFFINGNFITSASIGTTSFYAPATSKLFEMGRDLAGNTEYFTGHIRALRITKGIARYTSNNAFSPPSLFPIGAQQAGYRHFRLTISQYRYNGVIGAAAGTDTRVAELELYDAENVNNPVSKSLSFPYFVKQSSQMDATRHVGKAFDGNTGDNNRWISNTAGGEQWIQIYLDRHLVLSHIKIAPDSAGATTFPVDFRVEGSKTGAFSGEQEVLINVVGATTGWAGSTLRTFTV